MIVSSTGKLKNPHEIRENPAAREFRSAAHEFCYLLQLHPSDENDWCLAITSALSRLYAAGHRLPEVDIEMAVDVPDTFNVTDTEWKTVHSLVTAILRQQVYYWAYFDPSEPINAHDQTVTVGDLADDLADIFRDVKPGLAWWDANRNELLPCIVFDWGCLFPSHWGVHAVSALRALHPLAYLRGITPAQNYEQDDEPER